MLEKQLKLLFLSTPVGALGSGIGGGVELTLYNLAQEMQQRGHKLQIVAPAGSKLSLDVPIQEILGNCQVAAQTQIRDVPIRMPKDPVLGNMCEYIRTVEQEYDLIVNFAFDWLPFFLTPFYNRPVAHFISMGSLSEALDQVMAKIAQRYPKTIGVYTQSQASTFPFADICRILGSGVDLSLYQYSAHPQDTLAWLGRIAPEKALEDAVAAAQITQIPLRIFGKIQDEAYWQQIQQAYPDAPIEYMGFLSTQDLQRELSQCLALLMTPRWLEAFGNVAIEALACGVPVIAYKRGGPAEIVRDGETGFLVEPDSVEGLVAAIERIGDLNRAACRQQAEEEYSLGALGDRFETWFREMLDYST
jgi:UDP-glucose:tetrahydrobiopterin glucosyltransferase